MATVLRGQGKHQAALDMYNEALPVLEATLGHKHPLVAATKVRLKCLIYTDF